jgi:biopolymer transport protein TolR
MRDSRRMKRLQRNNRKGGHIAGLGLNLIPMMDVLSVLVFFLLFHSFNSTMPEGRIALPDSVVETRPRETITIVVTPDVVMIQGDAVVNTAELFADSVGTVHEVTARLDQLERNNGSSTGTGVDGKEITLLADKTIPYNVLKKIMSTCTASGYGRISLAVAQKSAKT